MNHPFLNKRSITKAICAQAKTNGGFVVRHDIKGEAIVCEVPTLEIAGCIVRALRERAMLRLAADILRRHREDETIRAGALLHRRAKNRKKQ